MYKFGFVMSSASIGTGRLFLSQDCGKFDIFKFFRASLYALRNIYGVSYDSSILF